MRTASIAADTVARLSKGAGLERRPLLAAPESTTWLAF
jgi:hypothetical protein